jgi:hypothetical protein
MNRTQQPSRQDECEVRIQLSWRYRLSGRAVARLLIVAAAILVTAATTLAHGELAGGALYGIAGFLAGSRPRIRS